jgi:hypothetical protein
MATIAFGAPSLARKRRYSAVSKQNSRASSQLPCKLLATACREALMLVLHKVASCSGSCSPARIASKELIVIQELAWNPNGCSAPFRPHFNDPVAQIDVLQIH